MNIVLEAENIVKSFGGNEVLKGVDFQLKEGEIVLLQGANGCGKTTLINILTGNLEPDAGRIVVHGQKTRRFVFPRPWYRRFLPFTYFSPERMAQSGLGRVWQDVRIFATRSLRDNIAIATPHQAGESPCKTVFAAGTCAKEEEKNLARADAMLARFGLAERVDSAAGQISFGQAKRVAIARALQAGAKILFLDEPLAGLDPTESANVIAILKDLAKEHRITLVIVEHDLNIPKIQGFATTIWNLADGKLTVNPVAHVTVSEENKLYQWIRELAVMRGGLEVRELANGGRLTIAKCGRERQPILALKDVTVNRGERPVILEPLNIELWVGDVALLEAPNGWGKSTLLDAMSGILPIRTGELKLKGQNVTNAPIWTRANLGLHLSRTKDTLFTELSVKDNLKLNCLTANRMADKQNRKAGSLSGGESRRLILTSALNAPHAKILLLDEPFQALDTTTAAWFRQSIAESASSQTFLITLPRSINK